MSNVYYFSEMDGDEDVDSPEVDGGDHDSQDSGNEKNSRSVLKNVVIIIF